jgi:hypothetical protein
MPCCSQGALCGKEACFKALGTGRTQDVGWHEIEILQSGTQASVRLCHAIASGDQAVIAEQSSETQIKPGPDDQFELMRLKDGVLQEVDRVRRIVNQFIGCDTDLEIDIRSRVPTTSTYATNTTIDSHQEDK